MQTDPAIPREFVEQFEAAHLHRLRQRVFWYCVAVLGLLVLAFTRVGLDLTMPADMREHVGFIALRVVAATTLVVCYVGVTLYILPAHRGREQIIKAYSLLIIATTVVVTLSMPRIDHGNIVAGARPEEFGIAAVAQQGVTLFFILLLHLIACLLVELSPRDGLRIYLPMLVIYAVGLAIDRYLATSAAIRLALIAPILGLPGLLWSLWHHRTFADQFVTRAMAERYGKVSKELADARRVHEAIFPPPLGSGPVRVGYRYEAMLDIGGDFLYIHPLTASRAATHEPISVVVIDVTGHGFPAALAVNRLYVELTRAFASSDDPSPEHIIVELNRSMMSGLMPDGIYATAIVLRVRREGDRGVLEWCGAGHPDAILNRANGDLVRLHSSGPMLGVIEPEVFRALLHTTEFGPGDCVIAYTDGVMETRGASGEQFGMERIEDAVRPPAPAEAAPIPAAAWAEQAASETGQAAGETAEPRAAAPKTAAVAVTAGPRPVDALFEAVGAFRSGPMLDDILIVEVVAAERGPDGDRT